MHFLLSALSIVLIDLLLAGDNALVIALAVRSLDPRERRIGTIGGAIAAVLLRVGLTFVAARLLSLRYLQLTGGLFVLWIAVKVLLDGSRPPESVPAPKRIWNAIWYIVVADITMSVDNILAIAGASRGHFLLILFGLAVSIPFVVLSSNLLSRLMDRWPMLVPAGSAVLAKVAVDMILADPVLPNPWRPPEIVRYAIEGVLALTLLAYGYHRTRKNVG